jgi:nanoRNase/pAp phosphatase (c-di-AMP/oligoRNAs hydrolase)
MRAELDPEMATNLLAAIEAATQTFRSLSVTPQTFEIAGRLLAAGARRVRLQVDQQDGKTTQPSASFATALGKQPQKEQRSQSQNQQNQRDKDKQKSKQMQEPTQFGGVSRS